MRMLSAALWSLIICALPPLSERELFPQEKAPSPVMIIEGVATSRQAAPVSALREMGKKLFGTNFFVYDGKYVELGKGPIPPPLQTEGIKLLSLRELETGLFKAQLEVQVPPDIPSALERLRERTIEGEAEIAPGGSVVAARNQACLAAAEKAILAAVEEGYQGHSAPAALEGKVFFLDTLRERKEGGKYQVLARFKVELTAP